MALFTLAQMIVEIVAIIDTMNQTMSPCQYAGDRRKNVCREEWPIAELSGRFFEPAARPRSFLTGQVGLSAQQSMRLARLGLDAPRDPPPAALAAGV